ncbi:MAG: cupin domain-containing protein [Chitinophagales bacterium]|nr:cupin domain-containing protein [Chitinophagales bacterium]
MKNKGNQATPLRPQGERVLNDTVVEMDINKTINQIKQENAWKDSDHNSITLFKSDKMRIVLIGLHENAELKTHTANAIISVQLIEGEIIFTAENESITLQPNQLVALQHKVPHSVKANKESFFLLTLAI